MAVYDPRRRLIVSENETRVRRGAIVMQRQLRGAAPVGEPSGGTLRNATTVTARGLTAQATVAVPYASYTNTDTEPHEIVARNAQALRFFWPGVGSPQPRFYKRVQHPGTSGTVDWYGETLDEWPEILQAQRVT